MQQTQTYKLNKPGMDDRFSVEPLNENMDKVEAQLARVDGAAAALDSRVAALELRHFAAGTYTGNKEETQFIEVGFTPRAVFVFNASANYASGLALAGFPAWYSGSKAHEAVTVVDNGFQVTFSGSFNSDGLPFRYFAFA